MKINIESSPLEIWIRIRFLEINGSLSLDYARMNLTKIRKERKNRWAEKNLHYVRLVPGTGDSSFSGAEGFLLPDAEVFPLPLIPEADGFPLEVFTLAAFFVLWNIKQIKLLTFNYIMNIRYQLII